MVCREETDKPSAQHLWVLDCQSHPSLSQLHQSIHSLPLSVHLTSASAAGSPEKKKSTTEHFEH